MTKMDLALTFDGKEIRVVGDPENPEWIAADVCRVLGIKSAGNAVRNFDDDERGVCLLNIPPKRVPQEFLTVTEPGLYRLIRASRKPEAKAFRRWLDHEVLPCIRQHGSYPAPLVEAGDRALIQIDPAPLLPILRQLTEGQTDTRREIAETREEMREGFYFIDRRLASVERRRKIPPRVQLQHIHVVNSNYNGRCPCCHTIQILSESGTRLPLLEFDHFISKGKSRVSETWAVCKTCNREKLEDPKFRHGDGSVAFQAYQQQLRAVLHGLNPQMRLFEDGAA